VRPSIAVPLWDWTLIGGLFLPAVATGAMFSGRLTAMWIYAVAWSAVALCACLAGRFCRLPFSLYLRAVLRNR
jgi:hypothetical protein